MLVNVAFRRSDSMTSVYLFRTQVTITIRIIAGGIAMQATEGMVLFCIIRQEPRELEKMKFK